MTAAAISVVPPLTFGERHAKGDGALGEVREVDAREGLRGGGHAAAAAGDRRPPLPETE